MFKINALIAASENAGIAKFYAGLAAAMLLAPALMGFFHQAAQTLA